MNDYRVIVEVAVTAENAEEAACNAVDDIIWMIQDRGEIDVEVINDKGQRLEHTWSIHVP